MDTFSIDLPTPMGEYTTIMTYVLGVLMICFLILHTQRQSAYD